MPIISRIGARSFKVRMVYGTIFLILVAGAVTMLYPLLLMLAGSVKSQTDFTWITPWPEYLRRDDVLWMKYVESKYTNVPDAEIQYHREIGSWRNLVAPAEHELVDSFLAFRRQGDWPDHWFAWGHWDYSRSYAHNARRFRRALEQRFDGDIRALSKELGIRYSTWAQVGPPSTPFLSRRFDFPQNASYQALYELKRNGPRADWIIVSPDGDFWWRYLRPKWPTVESYDAAHGTDFARRGGYRQVLLSTTPPAEPRQRDDWETYVREQLNVAFIRIDPAVESNWKSFLRKAYLNDVALLNQAWGQPYHFPGFEQVDLPEPTVKSQRVQSDLSAFLKDKQACPLDSLSVYGPRQAFEQFLRQQGHAVDQPTPLPIEQTDWTDFQTMKGQLRWEFVKRNYIAVIDYLLMHGNGIRNTLIFCVLTIATTLIVNPLAAYALSRYRPPSTYAILLFCMCTMAFPAEVTMIPSFLLLKRFPLFSLVVGIGATVVVVIVLRKLRPGWREGWIAVLAAGVGIVAGWWLAPMLAGAVTGRSDPAVSLLNTFWALVLPGMANGFSIFLLKGFFDSLPRELYEAADIDGANEWHKFWIITMSLSKPILAVLALGAFTAAYSEFMMALVIIPDQQMWTMMVWLFQLQQRVHPSVVYASLVIAAIPTFLMFVLCQNLIMRGIIVPVEK
jgi:multiple sugar transport system permease protein